MIDFVAAHDAAIFLAAGLVVAAVLIAARPALRTRERAVDAVLACFLLFAGVLRLLFLAAVDLFASGGGAGATAPDDPLVRLAVAEIALAVLAAFGVRASVPVRLAAVVPVALALIAEGVVFAVLLAGGAVAGGPGLDPLAATAGGVLALVLMALDWSYRSDTPDPLEPGGKSYTY